MALAGDYLDVRIDERRFARPFRVMSLVFSAAMNVGGSGTGSPTGEVVLTRCRVVVFRTSDGEVMTYFDHTSSAEVGTHRGDLLRRLKTTDVDEMCRELDLDPDEVTRPAGPPLGV